jgi:hypothetical protein
MKDFHSLVKTILNVWMLIYAALLLPGLVRGLVYFVLCDFSMPVKPALDIINTIHLGALWLVPTAFLWVAYYLSRPKNRYLGG